MAKRITNLKGTTNADILNLARAFASGDYKAVVPTVTERTISRAQDLLTRYTPLRNEFANALINKVGEQLVRSDIWKSPLAEFSGGMLETGESIEEIFVGLALRYDSTPQREIGERLIFGREEPDIRAAYHTINRQDSFKVTIDDRQLKRAIAADGGSGKLNEILTGLRASLSNSDNIAQYAATTALLRQQWRRGRLNHKKIEAVTNEATAKEFLVNVRAAAGNMRFPRPNYNPESVPSFVNPDDLCLFITPMAAAYIDVHALAAAFNLDHAVATARYILIDDTALPTGVEGFVAPKDFLTLRDTYFDMADAENPAGVYRNAFLHHDEIIAVSPFVPRACFGSGTVPSTSGAPGEVEVYSDTGEKLSITGNRVTVKRGAFYEMNSNSEPAYYRINKSESGYSYVTADGIIWVDPREVTGNTVEVMVTASEGGQAKNYVLLLNVT